MKAVVIAAFLAVISTPVLADEFTCATLTAEQKLLISETAVEYIKTSPVQRPPFTAEVTACEKSDDGYEYLTIVATYLHQFNEANKQNVDTREKCSVELNLVIHYLTEEELLNPEYPDELFIFVKRVCIDN